MRRRDSTLIRWGAGVVGLLVALPARAEQAPPTAGFAPASEAAAPEADPDADSGERVPADPTAPAAGAEPGAAPETSTAEQAPAPAAPPPYPYPYPYPYTYPYPYPYPAPPPPPADKPAKKRLPPPPPHTAVRSSPFLNLVVGGLFVNRYYSSAFSPGVEGGLFIADRVRIAARVMTPVAEAEDDYAWDEEPLASQGFMPLPSESPTLFGMLGLGVVVVDLPGFTLSPSVYALRSDVGDYGTTIGIALPFEWLTRSGVRVGFDFGIVRAFGGEVEGQCMATSSAGSCDPGEIRLFDREAGNGFTSSFIIGWALGRP